MTLTQALQAHFQADTFEELEIIQTLWSGYGKLSRFASKINTCLGVFKPITGNFQPL